MTETGVLSDIGLDTATGYDKSRNNDGTVSSLIGKLNQLFEKGMFSFKGIDNNIISVNGDIHICHKTDGSIPFANIHHLPIDYDKLVDIYVEHNRVVNQGGCRSCWAVRFCAVCGASRLRAGRMVNPTFDECEVIRLEQKLFMSAFFYAVENRPDVIEYLERKRENRREYISIMDIHTF